MAKLPVRKKKSPKNNDEVKVDVLVEKRNYDGTKNTLLEKGIEQENEKNPVTRLPEGKTEVGMSKGITINLGNYESARVNCWITKTSNDDEKSVMDAMMEVSSLIDEQLQFEIDEIESMKE